MDEKSRMGHVRELEKSDIPALIGFNEKVYPEKSNIKESMIFKFNNPDLQYCDDETYPSLVAVEKGGKIIGQLILIPATYHHQGNLYKANWGMDFIVEEKYRGSIVAVNLIKKALMKTHIGLDLTPLSLKMHLLFGEKIIGSFLRFVYFKSPWSFLLFVGNLLFKQTFHKRGEECYPATIELECVQFKLVDDYRYFDDNPWYEDIIEFSRNADFMQWRFGSYPETFKTYTSLKEGRISAYFVVRFVFWKNSHFLMLVDYRFRKGEFASLLDAVRSLAKTLDVRGVITISSLKDCDHELKGKKYITIGKQSPIITNIDNNISQDNIKERKAIIVTPADGNRDYFFGDNKWYQ